MGFQELTNKKLKDLQTLLNDSATGNISGSRLPGMSAGTRGAVPPTGYPSGKFLRDDGTFADAGGTSVQGVMEPDSYGDLMPRVSGTGTEVMEADPNGDLQPKAA